MSIDLIKNSAPLTLKKQDKTQAQRRELVESYEYIPDPYKKVASGMEKQFAEFMISQMESSTGAAEGNSATKYYKSLLNSERANIMATKDQGLGLQKVILDQIYPERMRTSLAYNQFVKSQNASIIKKNDIQIKKTDDDVQGKEPSHE